MDGTHAEAETARTEQPKRLAEATGRKRLTEMTEGHGRFPAVPLSHSFIRSREVSRDALPAVPATPLAARSSGTDEEADEPEHQHDHRDPPQRLESESRPEKDQGEKQNEKKGNHVINLHPGVCPALSQEREGFLVSFRAEGEAP